MAVDKWMRRSIVVLLSAALLVGAAACVLIPSIPGTYELMMPMPDGVRLYTCGTLPRGAKKCPVVVLRTPYWEEKKMSMNSLRMVGMPVYRRGYIYLVQHCRGTGMSEGDFVQFEAERTDGQALLDWIRKQPWYNGEIFLMGGSYHSSVHWAYLDTNPPDIKGAVLPIMDVDNYRIHYRNGFYKSGLVGDWSKIVYRRKDRTLKRDESVKFSDFPLVDFAKRYWGVDEPVFRNVVSHPRRDDPFWSSGEPGSGACSRRGFLDSTMPVMLVTGAYDPFLEGMCDMWRETPRSRLANCSLLIDACDHDGKIPDEMKGTLGEFPGGGRLQDHDAIFDWFEYCRTGKPSPTAPPGKVRIYSLWENAWIESDMPPQGPRRVDFRLGEGARSWTYDPKRELPDFPGSGALCFGGMRFQPDPGWRDDVVSFVLPPVGERLDVRGRMEASLAVSSDCEDTAFYVRVSVDKGEGRWYLLRDDITSLCADGREYAPGTEKTVVLRMSDIAFRLEKGDRLRVDVSSACSQFAPHGNVKGVQCFVREPKVARNTVFAERSTLSLFVDEPAAPLANR
ncbi:MAG: CocE/NonD family hydrolase [Kiritimatiellae bacterium]|nr:CocE/NonD family hydrolase [Kiritimatiellia bacterium]